MRPAFLFEHKQDQDEGDVDADWSVELGADDPVLEVPWTSPGGDLRFVDLRAHPNEIDRLAEVQHYPEMGEFLREMNGSASRLATVKCDVWESSEIEPAEEIFGGSQKIGSYCDVIFRDEAARGSFDSHEQFVRALASRFREGAPELQSFAEWIVRRSLTARQADKVNGYAVTTFIFGYGMNAAGARQSWKQTLGLVANGMAALSQRL